MSQFSITQRAWATRNRFLCIATASRLNRASGSSGFQASQWRCLEERAHERPRPEANLVVLWLFTLMNYIYGDIGMLFSPAIDPALLARLQKGLTSGGHADAYFLGGAIFMEISFLMLPISWLANSRVTRVANIGAGLLFA